MGSHHPRPVRAPVPAATQRRLCQRRLLRALDQLRRSADLLEFECMARYSDHCGSSTMLVFLDN